MRRFLERTPEKNIRSLRAVATAIARRRVIDLLRRESVLQMRLRRLAESGNGELPDIPEEVDQQLMASSLGTLLRALPDEVIGLLRARLVDGKTIAEIARLSGKASSTVFEIISRALVDFRAELEKQIKDHR